MTQFHGVNTSGLKSYRCEMLWVVSGVEVVGCITTCSRRGCNFLAKKGSVLKCGGCKMFLLWKRSVLRASDLKRICPYIPSAKQPKHVGICKCDEISSVTLSVSGCPACSLLVVSHGSRSFFKGIKLYTLQETFWLMCRFQCFRAFFMRLQNSSPILFVSASEACTAAVE